MSQQFASDNISGICPTAMQAMTRANQGHASSYGEDRYTAEVCEQFRALFETDCDVYFVFNGTAANSLALASLCQSYHSIICHQSAHVETDECGAPEFFTHGAKLLQAQGELGKLDPQGIEALVSKRQDIHYPKPKVISLTQATECGTVYSPEELHNIQKVAAKWNLYTHMDGARFANAVASLDLAPADITWRAGVDVLCFGGSKNGLAIGEAVIFFNKQLSEEFAYRCKQAGQLASKMRFMSSQWQGLLHNDVWLHNAQHANAMASRLAQGLATIEQVQLLFPVSANAVFVQIPSAIKQALHNKGWQFYDFIGAGSRLMCSWDTQPETVDRFISDVQQLSH
ncbi:low specificity L-threonine aldolase [Dasania sp. GY-MA-18]|uniref:L-threonine aldolase n=1 Tax=Dasania phycosphaerae TaxID=2950436 RepID=A0A9J6RGH7_9GAMM|nr:MULTISPECIES: low specificity L-threonine aldolase [Dasania]MCR8921152.1 low specificity L-threonine aldolase [Dasania sp. GY-MA-18]MCZ0863580.1 low specificity L-threonine aldolase [Dasania phycosphaerae]MCZ0867308.1 low specificity L-threonine aldolase [Dasania phycosphaerae]